MLLTNKIPRGSIYTKFRVKVELNEIYIIVTRDRLKIACMFNE